MPPSAFGLISLGRGEIDDAFRWFDRAIDVRDPHIIPLRNYPVLDPVRTDPRYHALLVKLNLSGRSPLAGHGAMQLADLPDSV